MTWYPNEFMKVPMTDMRMRPEPSSGYPGRTYRFYKGPKLFEFGYGLSYSKHSYEFTLSTPNTIRLNQLTASAQPTSEYSSSTRSLSVFNLGTDTCEKLKFSAFIRVESVGDMAGKHPVLLFVRHERAGNGTDPIKQLVGFESVSLNAGVRAEIEFVMNPCEHFSTANEDGLLEVKEGYIYLVVGDKEHLINIVL